MTEAVVSGKETRCLFINNGDDLLTLKKVVSKKSDKDDCEKQKHKTSKETNGSELNGNHNKTDSINFDVDNTSSLEPNLEMDSDTDRNITIDSICTQEDRESENIDISNENSNEADIKNGEKDIPVISIKCPDIPYSPSESVEDNEYNDLEDDDLELNNPKSPAPYFNISSRAPLHSGGDLDITLEDDNLASDAEILLINERKRKFEELPEEHQILCKSLRLWNIVRYPFQKIPVGTSLSKNETIVPKPEITIKEDNLIVPETNMCENNSDNLEIEESNKCIDPETETEAKDTSGTTKKFCTIM